MKGLFLKDLYLIRSSLLVMLLVFLIIGISLAYLSTPWVLTILATVLSGMIVASTINLDKSSGWIKTALTAPVTRGGYIQSKYLAYLLASLIGLAAGILFSMLAAWLTHSNSGEIIIFVLVSLAMALLAGSIILPFYFLLDPTMSFIGSLVAYPAAAGVTVGIFLISDQIFLAFTLILILAAAAFALSWLFVFRVMEKRDL